MAIYRAIQTSFWTDAKVADTFTPEEKLMYLYLLTNPRTNLCGCYELSTRFAAFEIGFKQEQIEKLLETLEQKRVIAYNAETREVIIVNWYRYNWTSSQKLKRPLDAEIRKIKYEPFRHYLEKIRYCMDTVSDTNGYGIDTVADDAVLFCSVSVTDTVSDSDTVSVTVPDTDAVRLSTSKRKSVSDDFEELWKIYPRKQGKKEAFESYKRARKDGVTDEIIRAGIEAYREYITAGGIESQYVKQGGTFFSQRAWNDDWTPVRKRDRLAQHMEDIDQWGKRYEGQNTD